MENKAEHSFVDSSPSELKFDSNQNVEVENNEEQETLDQKMKQVYHCIANRWFEAKQKFLETFDIQKLYEQDPKEVRKFLIALAPFTVKIKYIGVIANHELVLLFCNRSFKTTGIVAYKNELQNQNEVLSLKFHDDEFELPTNCQETNIRILKTVYQEYIKKNTKEYEKHYLTPQLKPEFIERYQKIHDTLEKLEHPESLQAGFVSSHFFFCAIGPNSQKYQFPLSFFSDDQEMSDSQKTAFDEDVEQKQKELASIIFTNPTIQVKPQSYISSSPKLVPKPQLKRGRRKKVWTEEELKQREEKKIPKKPGRKPKKPKPETTPIVQNITIHTPQTTNSDPTNSNQNLNSFVNPKRQKLEFEIRPQSDVHPIQALQSLLGLNEENSFIFLQTIVKTWDHLKSIQSLESKDQSQNPS